MDKRTFEDRFWNTVIVCSVIGAIGVVAGLVTAIVWLINHISII